MTCHFHMSIDSLSKNQKIFFILGLSVIILVLLYIVLSLGSSYDNNIEKNKSTIFDPNITEFPMISASSQQLQAIKKLNSNISGKIITCENKSGEEAVDLKLINHDEIIRSVNIYPIRKIINILPKQTLRIDIVIPVGIKYLTIVSDDEEEIKLLVPSCISGGNSGQNYFGLKSTDSSTATATPKPTPVYRPSITGQGDVGFETSSGSIENLITLNLTTLPPPPSGSNFLYGAFSFDIIGITPAGSSVTLTLTFPSLLPTGTTYWKYQAKRIPSWYSITPDSISGRQMTITLTDGGTGDDDGLANGIIHDPGSPNIPQTQTEVPEFPTILMPIAAIIGLTFLFQKRKDN